MYSSDITEAYRANLEALRVRFPEGAGFLDQLAADKDIWLSTDKNAHLYCGDKFLGYLKFTKDTLMFSPKFNAKIATHTHDANHLIFPKPIQELMLKYEWKPWGRMILDRGEKAFEFFPGKSRVGLAEFFDALVLLIKEKACD